MTTGLRPITDARGRVFTHPAVQAAWLSIDCGFPAVADVFEECCRDALNQLDEVQFSAYVDLASHIGNLGRGAEPLLAFIEEWPSVIGAAPGDSAQLTELLLHAIDRMQRSPNSRAITPFIQTLAPVAKRLRSAEQIGCYIEIAIDLMVRTSGSIHGRQMTLASPGLPDFVAQSPRLVGLLSIDGLQRWVDFGIRSHQNHPDRQAAYFSMTSPDAWAVLQRERHGTLFSDVERKLSLYLHAMWRDDSQLIPYSTVSDNAITLYPYYDLTGLRVPDVIDDSGVDRSCITGLNRYRAILAHMMGHRTWSAPQIADNWSPFQRMAVETFEDCRIDLLLMRHYPGLRKTIMALHPKPEEGACDPERMSCLRHRLTMLSRACIDPLHPYTDPDLRDFVRRFNDQMMDGISSTAAMAGLALAYVAKTRRQSDQYAEVYFENTVIDYRDDNRHLWKFIEESDDEDFFEDPEKKRSEEPEISGLPPRHYSEWDYVTQTYRPDWASVYEALHPSGNPVVIDRLLEKHDALAKRLKRLLDLLKPQEKQRIRYQEEGAELDLDVALRAMIDYRSGVTPDTRINMSHRTAGRDIAVLLLVDLSESLNRQVVSDSGQQTILELSQEAVSLLARVMDGMGDPLAIAGFHSNTRHEVRYQHIKGFSECWDDAVKARVAAMEADYSTRMGAALRHAGHYLGAKAADKRILLVLTDGEPADVDVQDPSYLRIDARKAVEELSSQGIATFCLSLDAAADDYVSEIFGNRWRVLDRIERLPEQLPLLYLSLTR